MSDTPQTDIESTFATFVDDMDEVVPADFARELERENAKLKEQLDSLSDELRARDDILL
ncbi:MAG: hypothetical protein MUP44_04745 [Anaerolineales bacterium]|nr:hypothetical protein [Anaerolineales bacterium]